jgi:hypothetical protein
LYPPQNPDGLADGVEFQAERIKPYIPIPENRIGRIEGIKKRPPQLLRTLELHP